jgi:hypothetical protein
MEKIKVYSIAKCECCQIFAMKQLLKMPKILYLSTYKKDGYYLGNYDFKKGPPIEYTKKIGFNQRGHELF